MMYRLTEKEVYQIKINTFILKKKLVSINLEKSQIGQQSLFILKSNKKSNNYFCLNLGYTCIEPDKFDAFMDLKMYNPFPENLKFLWIENTNLLSDE